MATEARPSVRPLSKSGRPDDEEKKRITEVNEFVGANEVKGDADDERDDERVDGAFLWHMDGLMVGVEDTSVLCYHSSDGRMLERNNDSACYSIRRDVSVT